MPYTARPGVDWNAVANMLEMDRRITETQQQQKIQAMQWQGQQDYQTLVQSGIEPIEALRRSAPKLFYNDPRGMANAIAATQKEYRDVGEPIIKTLPDGTQVLWKGSSYQVLKPMTPGPEQYTTVTTVNKDTNERQTRKVLTSELEAEKKRGAIEAATGQYKEASAALGSASPWLMGMGTGKNVEKLAAAEETLQKQGIDIPAAAAYAARNRMSQAGAVPSPGQVPAPAVQRRQAPPAPADKNRRALNQIYTTPDGRQMIWDGKAWRLPDKFETSPRDVQFAPQGIRG